MAPINCNIRKSLEATKCDAPVKLGSLDIRNESPAGTEFGFSNFLNCEITLGDNTNPRRGQQGDNGYIHSQSPLSVSARGTCYTNQQCNEANAREDNSLSNWLNTSEAIVPDQNTDCADSLSNSCENNLSSMKLKDNSESVGGGLSDLLSISIPKCDPSVRNGYCRSVSPVCNISLSDITIPEFFKGEESSKKFKVSEPPIGKNVNVSDESDFNLSDILSSICVDDSDRSTLKPLNKSHDQSFCLDDFKICDVNEHQHNGLNVKKRDVIAFNSLECTNAELDEVSAFFGKTDFLSGTENLDNDDKYSGNQLKSSTKEQVNLDCINIQDLIEDVNTNYLGSSLDDSKSTGFSFFSDPSKNLITFSQMLDDNRNLNKAQRSNSSGDEDSGISMLDLYNSLQSSNEGTSPSETNSSHSGEKEDSSTSDFDDQIMVAIDLSTCIKSFEDKSSFKMFMEEPEIEVTNPKLPSTPERVFQVNPVLSLPLRNIVDTHAPRMNLKQSLFAKALSCKSKKDPTLLHKVANIKTDLFNKVFGGPIPVTNKVKSPHIEVTTYSDKAITNCPGRRVFGPVADVCPVC